MLDDSLVSASIARTSRWARVALLLIPALALGQLSTNSVTVTPTEAPALQPDGAYFDVSVTSGSDKTLNDIVTALQGSGITAANFERLTSLLPAARTATPPQPSFQWTFQTLVPLTKLKETTAAFTTLAQRLPQNNSGLSLTFSVAGTAASAQQTTSCKLSDLVASARAQAQQLTSAAGLTSGMIVSLTAATSPSGADTVLPGGALCPRNAVDTN